MYILLYSYDNIFFLTKNLNLIFPRDLNILNNDVCNLFIGLT